MDIEELKRLAEAATPGPWDEGDGYFLIVDANNGFVAQAYGERRRTAMANAAFIAAANPAVVLELIAEIEYRSGKSREHFDAFMGCYEALKAVTAQRDELLVALKDARELVEDWGAYASNYRQEKNDLEGDLAKLDAAIAKAEGSL